MQGYVSILLLLLKVNDSSSKMSELSNLSHSRHNIWRKNFNNFAAFLEYTRIVEVIDGSHSKEDAGDVYNDLVIYLMHHTKVPVIVLSASEANATEDIGLTKRLIFTTFRSLQEFESTINNKWSLYRRCQTSFFVIVIAEISDFCTSDDYKSILKLKLSVAMDTLWASSEITEVYMVFPWACQIVLTFNPLVTCKSGECIEEVTKLKLVHTKTNLEHRPIYTNIFHRSPTLLETMPESMMETYLRFDTAGIGYAAGVDAFVLGNAAKYLNFTPVLHTSIDRLEYGSQLPNGTFTGSLGDVIYRRADISMNARFLKPYSTDAVQFSYPIYSDEVCWIVPKAKKIPNWLSIFLVFRPETWGMLFSTAVLISLIWWTFKTKLPSTREGPRGFMIILDVFLLIVSKPVAPPYMHGERLLIITCLFFNLLFSGIFQGFLMTAYSKWFYYKDLNTLVDVEGSGLPVMASNSIGDLFGTTSNPVMERLRQRVKTGHTPTAWKSDQNLVVVERKLDAKIRIELYHTDDEGEPLLHIADECPRYFYLTYMVRSGYPFLPHINRFIMKAFSAGLIEKWYDFTVHAMMLKHRMKGGIEYTWFELGMEDLQTAFIILVGGYIISSVVFVVELIRFKIERRASVCRKRKA